MVIYPAQQRCACNAASLGSETMKPWWLAQMARIDALTLRERLFLFLSVLVCSAAVVDSLWFSPAQTSYKQTSQRVEKQATELQRLREALRASASLALQSGGGRDELVQIAAQTEQVNQAVKQLLPDSADAAPLAQALVHLLRRHEGLSLVRTSALPSEQAGPGNAAPAKAGKSDASGTLPLPPGLTRQGVALTVSGAYADLTRYVQMLEADMPRVRWGEMLLNSGKGQPELTLKLYLLGEVTP
jgi:MSHA biogenesis protein MshJ